MTYIRVNNRDYFTAVDYLVQLDKVPAKFLNKLISINGINALATINATRQGEVRYFVAKELADHLQLEEVQTEYVVTKLPSAFDGQGHVTPHKDKAKKAEKVEKERVKEQIKTALDQIDEEFDDMFGGIL
jgi:hypothetical protein